MKSTRACGNVFKLFLSVTAAVLTALCMTLVIGCGKKSSTVRGETFYLYDMEDGTFDEREKIFIDGEKCVISVEGEDGLKDLNIDGKVKYGENGKITGSCGMIVTKLSDILSQEGLEELYDDLGVSSFEMKSEANIKLEFEGKKFNNVVVTTKQSMTIRGFEGLLSGLNGSESSTEREVYCLKDQTPDLSVNIKVDFNGGTLDGKTSITYKTDEKGKLDLSDIKPTRDGYLLVGYMANNNEYYTFWEYGSNEDATIAAVWRPMVYVTYNINSSEYKIDGESVVGVASGERVFPPEIVPIVGNPTTRFKGWYLSNDRCVDLYFGLFVSDNFELNAKWYSASDVKEYNDSIHTRDYGWVSDKSNKVLVHFKEKAFNEDDLGNYGGCSWKFTLYGVKNGQKDESVVYGTTSGFETTDPSGKICVTEALKGYKGGDAYLEVKDRQDVKGGFIILSSDFDLVKGTHIFVDESNPNAYRTRW